MAATDISAADVMKLRNRTGLSMMECKKALVEVGGDIEKAEDLLRKKLKGKMDSRTDRAAGAGRVAVSINNTPGAGQFPFASIIEVRAETDFTAINEKFVNMATVVANEAAKGVPGKVSAPTAAATAAIDELRISTGENCSFARGMKLACGDGASVFGSYVHHDGKTGVLIQGHGNITGDLLKQIGMHIVAAVPAPKGVSATDIPADVVEKERKFRIEQAIESGKPKEIAEKMVEGGMRKFFEELALLEQPYIMDPTKKVKEMLPAGSQIVTFVRYAVGEEA
ncbi:MAG: translation elongation factor Ts [Phycisphaerales bacterium]|nr:translation elongation factor Ts [Phycisphaerales bacterium]